MNISNLKINNNIKKDKYKIFRNAIILGTLTIGVFSGGLYGLNNKVVSAEPAIAQESVMQSPNLHISFTNESLLDSEGCYLIIKSDNYLKGFTQIRNDGSIDIEDMTLVPGTYRILLVCNSEENVYIQEIQIDEDTNYELRIDFSNGEIVIENISNSLTM